MTEPTPDASHDEAVTVPADPEVAATSDPEAAATSDPESAAPDGAAPTSDPEVAAAPDGDVAAVGDAVAPPEPVDLADEPALIALADLDAATAAGLEALLFLADEPLDVLTLAEVLDVDPSAVDAACQGLAVRHRREQRGTEVRRAAHGWRMYSAPLARPFLERWARSGRSGRLTQAALETLAVVAYKQPISRADIGEIRGVNADGAVRSLVARGLVAEAGRDDGPGQAVLYGTTTRFLERLGLEDLDDLPPLTDFLPEHAAPDEPELGRLGEVRRKLAAGGDLPGPGGVDEQATREAATRRFGDVRARLAIAGAEGPAETDEGDGGGEDRDVLPPPTAGRATRRDTEAEMDALTDRLDVAARSAVDRLRRVVADAEREPDDTDPTATPAGATEPTPADAERGADRG